MELAALEHACVIFTSTTDSDDRQGAESVLSTLRNAAQPYEFVRFVLTQSAIPLARFHAIAALREALLREWSHFAWHERNSFIEWLLSHALAHSENISEFEIGELVRSVAALWKRGWLDGSSIEREQHAQQLLERIGMLLHGNAVVLGWRVLGELLSEFESGASACRFALPLEFHRECFASFEQSVLPHIFALASNELGVFAQPELPIGAAAQCAFRVLVQLLSWSFGSGESILAFLSLTLRGHTASVCPGRTWSGVLDNEAFVAHYFNMLVRIETTLPQLTASAYEGLMQLASLDGEIFENSEQQARFLACFLMHECAQLGSLSAHAHAHQASRCAHHATVLRRIASRASAPCIALLPEAILRQWLGCQYALTEATLVSILHCGSRTSDDATMIELNTEVESFEGLMDAWVRLIKLLDSDETRRPLVVSGAAALLQHYAQHVFALYIRLRLQIAANELTEQPTSSDDEALGEDALSDRRKYKQQLRACALLARSSVASCGMQLAQLLHERVSQMQALIGAAQGAPLAHTCTLERLLEETHWLILVCGHVLADSRSANVPRQIQGENAQLAVVLAQHVLSVSELSALHSPLLAQTLCWFMKRLCRVYLRDRAPHEFFAASANALLEWMMRKIGENLCWNGETLLHSKAVGVLSLLCKQSNCAQQIANIATLGEIVRLLGEAQSPFEVLAAHVQTELYRALCSLAVHLDARQAALFLDALLKPLHQMWLVLGQQQQPSTESGVTLNNAMMLLDRMRGVAQCQDAPALVMQLCCEHFARLVALCRTHSSLLVTALMLMRDVTANQLRVHASEHGNEVLQCAYQVLQLSIARTQHCSPRERDIKRDLVKRILQLLLQLNRHVTRVPNAGTVVLHGISALLPHLSAELMQHRKIAAAHMALLRNVFSSNFVAKFRPSMLSDAAEQPCSLIALPTPLFVIVMQSIEYAITALEDDCAADAYFSLGEICNATQSELPQLIAHEQMQPGVLTRFIQLLFEAVLSTSFNHDYLFALASEALFGLATVFPEHFEAAALQIALAAGPSREHVHTALHALRAATGEQQKDPREVFSKRLEKFVRLARGALHTI